MPARVAEHKTRFILPARRASHIRNNLTCPLVWGDKKKRDPGNKVAFRECLIHVRFIIYLPFAEPQGVVPSVVVGVVGIGHVDGITENWDKEINVKELLRYVDFFLFVSNDVVLLF